MSYDFFDACAIGKLDHCKNLLAQGGVDVNYKYKGFTALLGGEKIISQ